MRHHFHPLTPHRTGNGAAARTPILALILILTLSLAPALTGASAAAEEITVPLTRPDQPTSLSISAIQGTVTVEGYDGREVRIESESEDGPAEAPEADAPEGMRRIPNRNFGLRAEEEDNRVTVHLEGAQARTIRALVPRDTSVEVDTVNGGRLTLRGVTGEHDLSNVNGSILVENVSGTVLAQTTNGDVTIVLGRPDPAKPMSFVTLNGDVDLTLPAGFAADLRLQTNNGEIFTDFEFADATTAPTVREGDGGRRYKVEIKQEVRGSINGGGPEIRMQTFNGNVLVRKAAGAG